MQYYISKAEHYDLSTLDREATLQLAVLVNGILRG